MNRIHLRLTALGLALASSWGCGGGDPSEPTSTSTSGSGVTGSGGAASSSSVTGTGGVSSSSSVTGTGGASSSSTVTGGGMTAGTGGATTSSSVTGTGGSGGSCGGTCSSCTSFSPWEVAYTQSGVATLAGEAPVVLPDGSAILDTFTWMEIAPNTWKGVGPTRLEKLDPAGNVAWDLSVDYLGALTSDGACGAYVAVQALQGASTILGSPVTCSAADGCFVIAHLDGTGAPLWAHSYDPGPAGSAAAFHLRVAADGHLVAAGLVHGELDFGGVTLSSPDEEREFVVALSAEGTGLWGHLIGVPQQTGPYASYLGPDSVVVSPAGDTVASSIFDKTVDFGAGSMLGPGDIPTPGLPPENSTYVAAFDPSGSLRFAKLIGGAGAEQSGWALAVGTDGSIFMAGFVKGAIDLGGGPVGVAGTNAEIVAKLDATGSFLWASVIDGVTRSIWEPIPHFALDAAGHVWIGGDGAVRELSATGTLLSTHPVGVSGDVSTDVVGFAPGGAPVVVGTFDDTVDLGQGPRSAGGVTSTFAGVLTH